MIVNENCEVNVKHCYRCGETFFEETTSFISRAFENDPQLHYLDNLCPSCRSPQEDEILISAYEEYRLERFLAHS